MLEDDIQNDIDGPTSEDLEEIDEEDEEEDFDDEDGDLDVPF
jgi:hypothetical protein